MGKKRNTNKVNLALPVLLGAGGKGGSGGSNCGRERGELASDMDELESVHSSLTGGDFGDSDEENDYISMVDSFGDQVENAQDKRIAIRLKAIDALLLVLHKSYIPESVQKWRGTLVELVEKNLKRTFDETVRVCSLAALISIQLGVDIEDEMCGIVEQMGQLCADESAGEAVRAACAQAIGICAFLSIESRMHRFDALQLLKNLWTAMKPSGTTGTSLFSSTLASWALLLERFEPPFIAAAIEEVQPKLCDFLHATTVEARISAGEALATLFELGVKNVDEDFRFKNQSSLEAVLGELALDSSRNRAKRDKKLQRLTFRQISDVVCGGGGGDGRGPVQQVRFNKREQLTLDGCHARLLYDSLCQLLKSDLNRQLSNNVVLRELFDLGAVLAEDDPQRTLSKSQKTERMNLLGEQQKQRNIIRSKGRAKKMDHKHDFGDE